MATTPKFQTVLTPEQMAAGDKFTQQVNSGIPVDTLTQSITTPKIPAPVTPSPVNVNLAPITPVTPSPETPNITTRPSTLESLTAEYLNPTQAPSLESAYNKAYGTSGISSLEQEKAVAKQAETQATEEFNIINAKIKAISDRAQAASLAQEGRQASIGAISGQQRDIQRQAAIESLPLQSEALIAQAKVLTAQNNTAAAQTALTDAQNKLSTLFSIQSKDIENEYNRRNTVIDRLYNIADKAQQAKLDEIKLANTQKIAEAKDLQNRKNTLMDEARKSGQPSLILELSKAKTQEDVDKIASRIVEVKQTSGSNVSTDNERALMSQFRSEPIVKDYNDILGQKGTIDQYIQNGVGGPADLALVFSFMKGLDPTSVVRETEYDTAAKSGNIFQGVFAKFNGYFKDKGGFLPANVKQEFQNLVNQKLKVKEAQYNNVKSQYEQIANRQGLNSQNVVIDYASGALPTTQTTSNQPAQIYEAQGTRYVQGADGLYYPENTTQPVTNNTPPVSTTQNTTPKTTQTGYKSLNLNYTPPTFNFFK